MAFYFYPGRVKQTSRIFLIQGGKADVIFEAGVPGSQLNQEVPQFLSTKRQKVVLGKRRLHYFNSRFKLRVSRWWGCHRSKVFINPT